MFTTQFLWWFICIFVILVFVYLFVFNSGKLKWLDKLLTSLSAIVLFVVALSVRKNQFHETFLELINLEEDISSISSNLVMYLTVFNNTSFNPKNPTVWTNIAPNIGTQSCGGSNKTFKFKTYPSVSRASGASLTSNSLIGPNTSDIGINLQQNFTIVLACKHGDLLIQKNAKPIEIIKLYANSDSSNNGLSFYIDPATITKNANNVQVGKLWLQIGNLAPFQCRLSTADNVIGFERDALIIYSIVKQGAILKVNACMPSNLTTQINNILNVTLPTLTNSLTNVPMNISSNANWNGYVYCFGIYNSAVKDISQVHSHIFSEYQRNFDQYQQLAVQYNTLASNQMCPYNKSICDLCKITNWNNMNAVLSSSKECKNAIMNYCKQNPKAANCDCWNSDASAYSTENCKLIRSIFSSSNIYQNMSDEDVEALKKKYNLITADQCPKPIEAPKLYKNTYDPYDFNKIKVTFPEATTSNLQLPTQPKTLIDPYLLVAMPS